MLEGRLGWRVRVSELSSLRQALYTHICRYPSAISPFPTHKGRALALWLPRESGD